MHRLFHPPMLRSQRLRISIGAIALFLAITGLAFTQSHADASSGSMNFGAVPADISNGTIPPGTIPPVSGPILHGLINVIHAAPIDSDINNTAIELCDVESNAKVGGPLIYGEQTGYEEIFMGEYAWFVALAGTNCGSNLHDISPFPIYAGTTLSVVIYGGANGHPVTSAVIAGNEGQRIQLLPLVRQEP